MQFTALSAEEFKELKEQLHEINSKLDKLKKQSPLSDEILDITDVCNLLNISKRCFFSYKQQGLISTTSIGGKVFVFSKDLEEILKKNYTKNKFKR